MVAARVGAVARRLSLLLGGGRSAVEPAAATRSRAAARSCRPTSHVIGIPQFANQTPYSRSSRSFTDKVRIRVHRPRQVQGVPRDHRRRRRARGRHHGSSRSCRPPSRPAAGVALHHHGDRNIELRDRRENNVLWSNPSIVVREEYRRDSRRSTSEPDRRIVDPARVLQPGNQRARSASATSFARSVVSAILEASDCASALAKLTSASRSPSGSAGPDLPPDRPGRSRRRSRWPASFVELVEPELRAFNVDRLLRRRDAPALDVVEAARTLPMMVRRGVSCCLLHAERLLNPKEGGSDERR